MRSLQKRMASLEAGKLADEGVPWVRIIGRTEEQARAVYEAVNGPIPTDTKVIFRRIVNPGGVIEPLQARRKSKHGT